MVDASSCMMIAGSVEGPTGKAAGKGAHRGSDPPSLLARPPLQSCPCSPAISCGTGPKDLEGSLPTTGLQQGAALHHTGPAEPKQQTLAGEDDQGYASLQLSLARQLMPCQNLLISGGHGPSNQAAVHQRTGPFRFGCLLCRSKAWQECRLCAVVSRSMQLQLSPFRLGGVGSMPATGCKGPGQPSTFKRTRLAHKSHSVKGLSARSYQSNAN